MHVTFIVLVILIIVCWFCISPKRNKRHQKKEQDTNEEYHNVVVTENQDSNEDSNKDQYVCAVTYPITGRIGEQNETEPLVKGAFFVISHHESGCFGSQHQIYLAIRNDGSIVYKDEEFSPGTLSNTEVQRIHELMIENEFFEKAYRTKEHAYVQTYRVYDQVYYTDGKMYGLLKHVPDFVKNLFQSLEARYRLRARAPVGPIGKFVY